MATKIICDLCGKEISGDDRHTFECILPEYVQDPHFDFKELRPRKVNLCLAHTKLLASWFASPGEPDSAPIAPDGKFRITAQWHGKMSEWTPQIARGETCYVIYRTLFGRYKIAKCEVMGIDYTNIWSWQMTNGWFFSADKYGSTVFANRNQAVEMCEKLNRKRKVKVVENYL